MRVRLGQCGAHVLRRVRAGAAPAPLIEPMSLATIDLNAVSLLQRTVEEQQALASELARLIGALGDRYARLEQRLTDALAMSSDACKRAQDADVPPRANVTCFGSFGISVDGRPINDWRGGKSRPLFQYLLLHRGQPVSRDALIEALWPDPDAVAAATSLKVAMHGLRQALRDAESADLRVIAHGAGYQLCTPRVWVDVEEFERLHGLGRRVERSDPPSALALYARAVELYRGDLLADGLDHWILVRRELLKDQQLMMLGKLADAALADGDYAECISRCCQILNQDRCREDAYRALMLCYARLNQPTRVRRRYELCVQGLRTYLDTDPEPATIKLYESLRAR